MVTVVTNLIPHNDQSFLSSPAFTFNSIPLTVTPGQALRVIYFWNTNVCTGPAVCTAALSTSCSSISVPVSSSKFKMPDIALEYLDAGNNRFAVDEFE